MLQIDSAQWKIYLKGFLIGIPVTVLLLLLFSGILTWFSIDRAFAAPLSTVSLAAGVFAAAFYSAYCRGEKGYLVGLIVGIIWFVLITMIGLLMRDGELTLNTLFHFIIILLCGMIGGIVGIGKKEHKKLI